MDIVKTRNEETQDAVEHMRSAERILGIAKSNVVEAQVKKVRHWYHAML